MTQAALPRCMAIPIDWKRKDLERRSSLMFIVCITLEFIENGHPLLSWLESL